MGGSLPNKKLGAAARNENARIHLYSQAAKLRPPKDMLKRQPGPSAIHH
jgi:hypothetical protein